MFLKNAKYNVNFYVLGEERLHMYTCGPRVLGNTQWIFKMLLTYRFEMGLMSTFLS